MSGEFDREMEAYIAKRRQSGLFHGMAKAFKRKKQPALGPEVKPYAEEPPAAKKDVRPMEQSAEVQAQEMEPPKQGFSFLGFLKGIFGSQPSEAEQAEAAMAAPAADDSVKADMKELSRITLDLAKMLPHDRLKEFKESPDFGKMKDILRKHKIIK
jgi:hypothetical protein